MLSETTAKLIINYEEVVACKYSRGDGDKLKENYTPSTFHRRAY